MINYSPFFDELYRPPPPLWLTVTGWVLIVLSFVGLFFQYYFLTGFSVGIFIGAYVFEKIMDKKMQTWPLIRIVGKLKKPFLKPKEFVAEFNKSKWGFTHEAMTEAVRVKTCIVCGGDLEFKEVGNPQKGGAIRFWSCLDCNMMYGDQFGLK